MPCPEVPPPSRTPPPRCDVVPQAVAHRRGVAHSLRVISTKVKVPLNSFVGTQARRFRRSSFQTFSESNREIDSSRICYSRYAPSRAKI